MSSVSKIKNDGVLYDIEDSTARADISDLKSQIDQKSGLTEDVKVALLNCFEHIGGLYTDPNARTYIASLRTALYPPANLTSISAVYTQSGAVYDTDSLDSLKADLVVTANYDNGTSEIIDVYTLSGELTEGTSVVTVMYGGKSTTFNVTVSETLKVVFQSGYTRSNATGKLETASNRSVSSIIPVSDNTIEHTVSCKVDGTAVPLILRMYDQNGICDASVGGYETSKPVYAKVSAFSVVLQQTLSSDASVTLTVDDQTYPATIGTVEEYSNTVPLNVSIQAIDGGQPVASTIRVLTDYIDLVPVTSAAAGITRFDLKAPSGIYIKVFEFADSTYLPSDNIGNLASNEAKGNVASSCTRIRVLFKKSDNSDFTSADMEALTLDNYGLVTYDLTEV